MKPENICYKCGADIYANVEPPPTPVACWKCVDDAVRYVEQAEKRLMVNFKDSNDYRHRLAVERAYSERESEGMKLRLARTGKRWTQDALGVHIGVSRNYVKEMELGRKPLNAKALEFIAKNPCNLTHVTLHGLQKGLQGDVDNKQVTGGENEVSA